MLSYGLVVLSIPGGLTKESVAQVELEDSVWKQLDGKAVNLNLLVSLNLSAFCAQPSWLRLEAPVKKL